MVPSDDATGAMDWMSREPASVRIDGGHERLP
jgi:hypothetical protein